MYNTLKQKKCKKKKYLAAEYIIASRHPTYYYVQ